MGCAILLLCFKAAVRGLLFLIECVKLWNVTAASQWTAACQLQAWYNLTRVEII